MCLHFVPQPFLLPSESRLEYDSEESLGSEDEEDEEEYNDAFDSSSPLREHSNHNSYRCSHTSSHSNRQCGLSNSLPLVVLTHALFSTAGV